MKKPALIFISLVAAAFFYSFILFEKAVSDVLQQLGVEQSEAKENVWLSFTGGYFSYPFKPGIAKTPVSDRARMVNEIGVFAKNYTRSQEFKDRYAQYRLDMKPTPPTLPESADESKMKQKADMEKSIRDMEETIAQMPADQRPAMREVVAGMKQQMKEMDNPGNQTLSNENLDKMNQEAYHASMLEHAKNLRQWENDYPTSPDNMLRSKLKKFLEISKDIDFNAQLTTNGRGKKIFTNPQYETKPSDWKMCFRSGRESVTAARSFAQQWLTELH